jgi:hypothetical protein
LEPEEVRYYPEIQGFSEDGTTTVFRAPAKLTENASSADITQVYAAHEGILHLVSVLPSGEAASDYSSAGTMQGIMGEFKAASVDNAISEDGEQIFWTECRDNGCNEGPTRAGNGGCVATPAGCQTGSLYVRIHPLQPQSKVAASRCTQPAKACTYLVSAEPETRFLGATPDGTGVLYLAGSQLYERNVTDLVADGPDALPTLIAGGVSGVLGFGLDLTHVYLESTEVCGANSGAEGSLPSAGSPNLYLYEPGEDCAAGNLDYIATLGSVEKRAVAESQIAQGNSPINLVPSRRTARVTPGGTVAVFTSSKPLTGAVNTDAASAKPDAEVFRFDAQFEGGGDLVCVSCGVTGAAPSGRNLGESRAGEENWVASTVPGWIDQLHAGNPLSADGERVFFESFDQLVPRDDNGRRDVYEWEEASGEAQCLNGIGGEVYVPASEGCLSLISTGESKQDSYFVDASADGRDAFIVTDSSLVPQDPDFRDVYDARKLGGFVPPNVLPPPCEGDGCRQAGEAPSLAEAGSRAAGPGNPRSHPRKACKPKKHKGSRKGKGGTCHRSNGHRKRTRGHHPKRHHHARNKAGGVKGADKTKWSVGSK